MSETPAESAARAKTAALIRDYYAAFNAGKTDAMLDLLTDDIIHDVNQGERRHGKDKFRAFNARMDHNYKEELKDIVVMVSKDGTRPRPSSTCTASTRTRTRACRRPQVRRMFCRPERSSSSATARSRA